MSLQRVAQVLLDAWEVGSHQWKDSPLQLKERPAEPPPAPLPHDALDLFRMLSDARVPYLLVGGVAMLTYVVSLSSRASSRLTCSIQSAAGRA